MATPTGRPGGRPAKPTEVKRALGNPGHRPLPAAPAPGEGETVTGEIPPAPALGSDGRELWDQLWTAGRLWLSPSSDVVMIEMLCQAKDEYEEIRRSVALGEVRRYYTTNNGQVVTHPLIVQMKDLRVQMTAWLSALGFTPTDRARLGLNEVRQADPLDELERRRQAREAAQAG